MNLAKLKSSNPFCFGYLMAAFWTYDDNAPSGEYSDSGRPEIMFERLSAEALLKAINTCANFQENNLKVLSLAGDDEQNGHDLWLTRNRHGAGYWDRGYSDEIADALTDAAHKLGESDLYTGYDKRLYLS